MSKSKKYSYLINKDSDTSWTASIVRQVSSKKNNVSKTQSEFATEQEAKEWAEAELVSFQETQTTRNSRKNEQRKANQTMRADRSSRKAAKTAEAKKAAEAEQQQQAKESVTEAAEEGFDDFSYEDNSI